MGDAQDALHAAGAALADVERVISDPLRFKRKLNIGTRAFALLRARDGLFSLWDSAGAATAGASVAQSAWVAGTFFAPAAPSGVLAWLGLGATAAVTPAGWVVATALVSGGDYFGVMKWIGGGSDHFVDTIPKFINTPIDLLGAQLLDLIGALALRVAAIDGHIDPRERASIREQFLTEWGFDGEYVDRALSLIEAGIGEQRVIDLAGSIAAFQRDNPDCNAVAMQDQLILFLRDVIAADGVIDEREELAIAAIERVFNEARHVTLSGMALHVRGSIATTRAAASDAFDSTLAVVRTSGDELVRRWKGLKGTAGGD